MARLTRLLGVARSLAMYRGIPFRQRRLIRHYATFIRPGSLCFDLGAHVGNRVSAWRSLGARVIAVEPQPDFVRLLRWLHGNDPQVTILPVAVGAREGRAELLVSERTPTVTSLSRQWTRRVRESPGFSGVRWQTGPQVPVTTLDALIAQYGVPQFVKIDVEGMELEVLRGLSQAVDALSFEYLPPARELALGCLSRLDELGPFRYNRSVGERQRLIHPQWIDGGAMATVLRTLPGEAPSGDIYARLNEIG